MEQSPIVTVNKGADPAVFIGIIYGAFLLTALFCFVNPFFKQLFIFSSVIAMIISVASCVSAYKDKENGIERDKPTQKRFFPKWTLHVFFIIMIGISAGLGLGYYFIAVCWVISWAAMWSGIQHIKATWKKEEDHA